MRNQERTKWMVWVIGALLVGMLGSASGGTISWTGNVNSNWADTNNWSPTTALPGTNDTAYFAAGTLNGCVVPSNTTQAVSVLDFRGFADAANFRKLIIQPGAALHNMTNTTTYILYGATGDRGIIEVQSNAVLTSSNCNFYIASGSGGRPVQGTMNVIGGRVIIPNWFGFGLGNETLVASGYYTGMVNVSAGGYISCGNMNVAAGGWDAAQSGRGLLTISDEGSLVQVTTLTISQGTTGASVEGNARGSVIIYGGTLSVGTFYNAYSHPTNLYSTNIAMFAIRGGQLLVSGNMYNTSAERNTEQGTVTIASGATNLLVSGNYYQRTNGTLVVEITATNHPPLRANGTNFLAGTLRVSSNSVEQLGQWDIVIGDADTNSALPGISGQFNTFDASATPHPPNWTLSYTADKVILSYSPRGTLVKCH